MPSPSRPQDQRWREEAHSALAKFSKAMDFFLFVTSELIKLTQLHRPDEFSHCGLCKVPWPCPTMQVVERIGEAWRELQEQTDA